MIRSSLKHALLFAVYGASAIVLAAATAYVVHLEGLPDLMVWHTARLDAEFRADDAGKVKTLADYRALEERLFGQLKARVYDQVPPEARRGLNRYSAGSLSDPLAQPVNWNRTFELSVPQPRGGVLLLHGLSDSPYSLRALGERLHALGYHVIGLRLPGHGTAPAGLLRVHWRDMAAATRLAARDLRRRLAADRPLYVIGYSTGAALAVEYALARLQGEDLPAVEKLVLISPAIGVSAAAALAVWQGRISVWLGLPKVAWTDIGPEYDPYKYTSFTVNAADQVHGITRSISEQLAKIGRNGPVEGMPKVLVFQSAVDATVSATAVADVLLQRLAPEGHEAVVFDLNRHADAADLFRPGALEVSGRLLRGPALPFALSVFTNASADSLALDVIHRAPVSGEITRQPTGLAWPDEIFSLSHVALPFPPDDPIYGAKRPAQQKMIFLGRPELLGERGLLAVSPAVLLRLRHNPFYSYLNDRVERFLESH